MSLVLITSIVFPEESNKGDATENTSSVDSIGMFASQRINNLQSTQSSKDRQSVQHTFEYTDEQYILNTPKFSGQFTGTGDICAALFLAWTSDNSNTDGSDLATALEKLAGKTTLLPTFCRPPTTHVSMHDILFPGTMNAIVKRTANAAEQKQRESSFIDRAKIVSSRELQLIQSRDDILYPPSVFKASKVYGNGYIATSNET